jgi:hypothetical protein
VYPRSHKPLIFCLNTRRLWMESKNCKESYPPVLLI